MARFSLSLLQHSLDHLDTNDAPDFLANNSIESVNGDPRMPIINTSAFVWNDAKKSKRNHKTWLKEHTSELVWDERAKRYFPVWVKKDKKKQAFSKTDITTLTKNRNSITINLGALDATIMSHGETIMIKQDKRTYLQFPKVFIKNAIEKVAEAKAKDYRNLSSIYTAAGPSEAPARAEHLYIPKDAIWDIAKPEAKHYLNISSGAADSGPTEASAKAEQSQDVHYPFKRVDMLRYTSDPSKQRHLQPAHKGRMKRWPEFYKNADLLMHYQREHRYSQIVQNSLLAPWFEPKFNKSQADLMKFMDQDEKIPGHCTYWLYLAMLSTRHDYLSVEIPPNDVLPSQILSADFSLDAIEILLKGLEIFLKLMHQDEPRDIIDMVINILYESESRSAIWNRYNEWFEKVKAFVTQRLTVQRPSILEPGKRVSVKPDDLNPVLVRGTIRIESFGIKKDHKRKLTQIAKRLGDLEAQLVADPDNESLLSEKRRLLVEKSTILLHVSGQ